MDKRLGDNHQNTRTLTTLLAFVNTKYFSMGDDFALEITKRAIARTCTAIDLKYSSSAALDILSDVLICFIKTIGENIKEQAASGGRRHPGFYDAVIGLEQMVIFNNILLFLPVKCFYQFSDHL